MSCQWSRGFEWRARALGITLGKAAELAEEGGCKLIRLAARRTAERTAIRPLAWKKDEGERLRAVVSAVSAVAPVAARPRLYVPRGDATGV